MSPTLQVDSLPTEPQGEPKKLEWVVYPFSSISSRPRNWTRVSRIAGGFFTNWAFRETLSSLSQSVCLSVCLSLSLSLCVCIEKQSGEHTVRRQSSVSQEEGPHQEPNLPAPWPWTFQPPKLWKVDIYCLSKDACLAVFQVRNWDIKTQQSWPEGSQARTRLGEESRGAFLLLGRCSHVLWHSGSAPFIWPQYLVVLQLLNVKKPYISSSIST